MNFASHTDDGHPDDSVRLVPEQDVQPEEDAAIRDLLMLAFPRLAACWETVSFWGSLPEYRLWIEDEAGDLLAHLAFSRRTIDVGGQEVLIAGIGGVCTRPDVRSRGFGRRLFGALGRVLRGEVPASFGFLGCREEVVGFYERCGFTRVPQSARFFDPDDRAWVEHPGPALILPARSPLKAWPRKGLIDLRGLPW